MGNYAFDNGWERERERLAGLENLLDPGTTRHLDAIGVGRAWTCLEIAGGGGSITAWLCKRVGPSGRVLATDLDTRFLDALDEANLDVLHHDVVNDELPEASFDLIHARLLLEHLPEREQVVKRLVACLKPGGWVLFEDGDWRAALSRPPAVVLHPASELRRAVRVWRGAVDAMRTAGWEAEFGARLPTLLLEAGLEDVGAEGRSPMCQGGSPGASVYRWSLVHLRDRILASGRVRERDLDREIAASEDSGRWQMLVPIVAAWGRRPAGGADASAPGVLPEGTSVTLDRLRDLPLFAGCSHDELRRVSALAELVDAGAGTTLTTEGEAGDLFYVILRGTATVSRGPDQVARLGPGSFFGETALLTDGPRTATVTADTRMSLAALDRRGFDSLLNESRTVARRILEGVAERSPTGTGTVFP